MNILSGNPDRIKKLIKAHRNEKEVGDASLDLTWNEKIEREKDWITLYRRNWELYARDELGISLKEFQEIAIHQIGITDTFFFFCSRGASKSFQSAIAVVILCLLYPYTEVIITASTVRTAKKFIKEKIEKELCIKISPKLRYMRENGLMTFKYSEDDIGIRFFNGSSIMVLPESEDSVGSRSTALIFEEARRSKLSIIDRVFMPMKHNRQPEFLNNKEHPEYATDPRLFEKSKTIYLTSMSYKFEPIWKRWTRIVENAFNNTSPSLGTSSFLVVDCYVALFHNLISVSDYTTAKNTSSKNEFEMEYLNHSPSEGDGNYYEYKMFAENQILDKGFIPPSYNDWVYKYKQGDIPCFREKRSDEKRVVYVDFAFGDIKNGDNDLTVIGCMSGYPNKDGDAYVRNLDYLTTKKGIDKEDTLKLIRELFLYYESDYLMLDIRNGGLDRFQDLSASYFHPELNRELRGFTVIEDSNLAKEFYNKSDTFRGRNIDPHALPVTILVAGTDDRNDSFHRSMRDSLISNKIRLLKDSYKVRQDLEEDDSYFSLTSEDVASLMLPHIQTENLITEAIQLEKKIVKGGFIKLSETGRNTKDRIVATEYANFLYDVLEIDMKRNNSREELDSFDDFRLVF